MRLMWCLAVSLLVALPLRVVCGDDTSKELEESDFKNLRLPIKAKEILELESSATTDKGVTYSFSSRTVLNLPAQRMGGDREKYQKELEKYKEKFERKGKVPIKFYTGITEANPNDRKTSGRPKAIYSGKTEAFFILLPETTTESNGENESATSKIGKISEKKLILSIKEDNSKLCPT